MNERHLRVNEQGAAQIEHHRHLHDQRKVGALTKKDKAPKAAHFAGPSDLPVASGVFAANLSEFEVAVRNLTQRFDDFTREVNSSPELAGALPAGAGPVAAVLGPAFRHRMGADGGMDYAIRANLGQLDQILNALRTTMDNYKRVEQDATSGITGEQW